MSLKIRLSKEETPCDKIFLGRDYSTKATNQPGTENCTSCGSIPTSRATVLSDTADPTVVSASFPGLRAVVNRISFSPDCVDVKPNGVKRQKEILFIALELKTGLLDLYIGESASSKCCSTNLRKKQLFQLFRHIPNYSGIKLTNKLLKKFNYPVAPQILTGPVF